MTSTERPSATQATRAVDANTDLAIRHNTCRSLLREAAGRCARIGTGTTIMGLAELEFSDRLERALNDYLNARADPELKRNYIGLTSSMDEVELDLNNTLAEAAGQQQSAA